tara:strand:+ start:331 stop:528 length:198 start_codon:yes stop_codon:yes gene_type:complete
LNKKVAKTNFSKKDNLFQLFGETSLIQMLITFEQKIKEDFRRRHWIFHEKIFQKRLKIFYFSSIC